MQDLIAKCPKKCPVCYKINVEIAWQPFCNYSGGFHERTPFSREKVSLTRSGRFWECKNAEFVWELRTMVFCESGRK